jgi:hypothetical protein
VKNNPLILPILPNRASGFARTHQPNKVFGLLLWHKAYSKKVLTISDHQEKFCSRILFSGNGWITLYIVFSVGP